jgi:hypothetical protein
MFRKNLTRYSANAAEVSHETCLCICKKTLSYQLTTNKKDYVYEKFLVIRLSSKVLLELYGRIRRTKIYK